MKIPLKTPDTSEAGTEPDAVQRAAIMLEMTRNQEQESMKKVLKSIHDTATERGERIVSYLDYAKEWVKDMKEIAGT